ncbi:putative specificity protein s [Vibrionales bacterium SWAT-3]|nr:putative specificity protein s [Vibrionales bacterium SWAT-3]
MNPGDTIVGTVRPGNRSFAYIGQTEQPLTGSTGFAVLTPKEEFWSSLVYLATTNDDSIDEYARLADGGAYPAIKPAVVAETECAIPTGDIAKKFWEITGPMLKKANQNRLENEELAALRDTLLPKLLSGDIELPASEAD